MTERMTDRECLFYLYGRIIAGYDTTNAKEMDEILKYVVYELEIQLDLTDIAGDWEEEENG